MKYYHIIAAVSVFGLFNTILVGFILFTPILRYMVSEQKSLKQGNEMRDFYVKLPIPLDFRVYFFNISNPEEVVQGHKPIVKEVGPYCYDAYKEKVNIEEDVENDTLTYSPNDTYFFNKTCSGTASQDDEVTILHPLIVAMINSVALDQPQFLMILNKALPIIFKENNSIYLTTKVRDVLFDGVLINCTVRDFSAIAVCSQFKGQSSIKEVEKNLYSFSLFGSRNGTAPRRITVKRGIKKAEDIGKVSAIDNETDLVIWPEPSCNQFHGTDGWIFPSFLKPEDGIWTVSAELCRSIKAEYVDEDEYEGVSVRRYTANYGDPNSNPEEKCYCKTPDACLPKGIMDLTKCFKIPLYCTLPHFLDVDEHIQNQIDGLSPNNSKHVIEILFEPFTGTPMVGHRRIQFNLMLQPLEKISIMENVPDALHPILWLEEGIELHGMLLKKITNVFLLLKVMAVIKYICLIACIQGIAYGGFKMYTDRKASKVIPMTVGNVKTEEVVTKTKGEQISLHSVLSAAKEKGHSHR